MRRLPAAASLIALTALCAPAARAQTTPLAWEQILFEDPTADSTIIDVFPAPDDGVTVLLRNNTAPGTTVISFTENGDQRWQWEALGKADAADVDAAGNTYVVHRPVLADRVLTSLDTDGQVRWTLDLYGPPTGTQYGYWPCDIDVAEDGECRVAGASHVNFFYPRTIVHAVSPTGTLLWRYDRSNGSQAQVGYGSPRKVMLTQTGETHVVGTSEPLGFTNSHVHYVLSSAGDLVHEWSGGPNRYYSSTYNAGVAPNGDVAFAHSGASQTFGGPNVPFIALEVVTPGGQQTVVSLLPHLTSPDTFDPLRDLAYDETGNIWIGVETPNVVLRFDGAGNWLSTWPVPGHIESLRPTADGGVVVLCTGASPDQVQMVRMDQAGTIVDAVSFDGEFRPSLRYYNVAPHGPSDILLDSRGNPVACALRDAAAPSSATHAILLKWVDGGAVGTPYCGPAVANSTGGSASIQAFGSDAAASNNVTLFSSGLPVNTTVLLLGSLDPGLVVRPGGSAGNLCLGGSIGRFLGPGEVRRSRHDGTVSLQIDLAAIPQGLGSQAAVAGDTWRFQSWYRDIVGGTQTSNFTDATALVLQ